MSCSSPPVRTIRSATTAMFSQGGNSPGLSEPFVVSPDAIEQIAPLLLGIRCTIIVENATVDFMSQVGFQTTDDGKTWASPVYLEASSVAGNRTLTTACS